MKSTGSTKQELSKEHELAHLRNQLKETNKLLQATREQLTVTRYETEETFFKVFQANPALCALTDPKTHQFIEINKTYLTTLGFSREDVVGKTVQELNIFNDEEEYHKAWNILQNEGKLENYEIILHCKNGQFRYGLGTSEFITVQGKEYIFTAINDITDSKRVLDELRESKEVYRRLTENMSEILWQVDTNLKITYVSPSVEHLSGFTPSEVSHFTLIDFLTPDSKKEASELATTIFNTVQNKIPLEALRKEFELIKKDGESFWAEISFTPIYTEENVLSGFQGITRDISERKQAEQILNKREQQYRLLFENSPTGMISITPDGVITDVNPAALRILGSPSAEATRAINFRTFPLLIESGFTADYLSCLEKKEVLFSTRPYTSRWGEFVILQYQLIPVLDDDGEVLFVQFIIEDITEKKRSEDALKESEERFSKAFQSNPSALIISRIDDGVIIEANKTFFSLIEYTPEEILGISADTLNIIKNNPARSTKKRIFESEETIFNYELTLITKSGHERFVLASFERIDLNNERCILTTLIDISERKKSEEETKQSLSLLKATLESTADGILVVDQSGNVTGWNSRFSQLWKIPAHLFTKRNDQELLSYVVDQLNNKDDFLHKVQNLYSNPDFESFDILEFKDGRIFERYSRPQFIDGIPVGRVWSFRDITEKKQAETELSRSIVELQASEEKYRVLFEDSKDGIFIATPSGVILDANTACIELFGCTKKDDILSLNLNEHFVDTEERILLFTSLQQHGYVKDMEIQLLASNTTPIVVSMTSSVVRNQEKEFVAYRSILHDLTQQKFLQEKLINVQKMESLGTLAAGIAHDFNNILGILLGHIGLIKHLKDDPKQLHESLDSAEQATMRGALLVRQLLTFARKTEVLYESLQLSHLLHEVSKLLQETFPKSIDVTITHDEKLPNIYGDVSQIHQMLINLCVNARDAMPNGGNLSITSSSLPGEKLALLYPTASSNNYVAITISDTGTGMNDTIRKRIFEPFFTTKGPGRGTGLGLSIVFGIVQSHKGFIDVQSEIGRGSIFNIYLPAEDRQIDIENISPTALSSPAGGTETILVIEDELALRTMLTFTLSKAGYKVITAADGIEGIKSFQEHITNINLVITDMGLPTLNGYQVLRTLVKIDPTVKVIVASGYFEPEMKTEIAALGVREFLQKPYMANELLAKIRRELDRYHS